MESLLLPFEFEFFRNGLVAAVLVGGLCGLIGVYVVLRGMSYIGHGLSHAVFGGAVLSYVMQWNFYLGAGLWGFIAALLINQTTRRYRIGADAAIGIVTTASFAFGVALISRVRKFTTNFDAALFGNVLGVTTQDVAIITLVSVVTLALVLFFYKELLFVTFDREVAYVYGIRVEWIDSLLSLILAAAIIVSMQTLGVTLIAAALVIPPITARLLTDNFGKMMLVSALVGALCAAAGMYLSFLVDMASGAAIVLVLAGVFVGVLAFRSVRDRGRALAIPQGDIRELYE